VGTTKQLLLEVSSLIRRRGLMDIPNGSNVASDRDVDPSFVEHIAPVHTCYAGLQPGKSRRITLACTVFVAIRAMLTVWQPARA
jgi:hypothetical protein